MYLSWFLIVLRAWQIWDSYLGFLSSAVLQIKTKKFSGVPVCREGREGCRTTHQPNSPPKGASRTFQRDFKSQRKAWRWSTKTVSWKEVKFRKVSVVAWEDKTHFHPQILEEIQITNINTRMNLQTWSTCTYKTILGAIFSLLGSSHFSGFSVFYFFWSSVNNSFVSLVISKVILTSCDQISCSHSFQSCSYLLSACLPAWIASVPS